MLFVYYFYPNVYIIVRFTKIIKFKYLLYRLLCKLEW